LMGTIVLFIELFQKAELTYSLFNIVVGSYQTTLCSENNKHWLIC
jgi:hypothetical protein